MALYFLGGCGMDEMAILIGGGKDVCENMSW